MSIEKFLKYSYMTFIGIWILTSFSILFFFLIGILMIITQKPELQMFLILSIIIYVPLVTLIIPLTFLIFVVSIFIYIFKFGVKESFIRFKTYLSEIKFKLISLFKDSKLEFIVVIIFLLLVFAGSCWTIYQYMDIYDVNIYELFKFEKFMNKFTTFKLD